MQVRCKFCGESKIIRIQGQKSFVCGKCRVSQEINSKTVQAISHIPPKSTPQKVGKIIEFQPQKGKIVLKVRDLHG